MLIGVVFPRPAFENSFHNEFQKYVVGRKKEVDHYADEVLRHDVTGVSCHISNDHPNPHE